jgi:hypothetical protein
MHRERQPSSPIIDTRDDPLAPHQADLDAALKVLASQDAWLANHETRLLVVERHCRASSRVELRLPSGWRVSGKGWYLIALAALAVTGLALWLTLG